MATTAAAGYPERPVRVVVPSAPGGVPDVNTRVVVAELSQQLGRPFVVDNRPGGSGLIGFAIIAQAPPDGYTIGYGTTGTLAINRSMSPGWPYELDRDIQPVVLITVTPFVLAVASSLPVKSVAELTAHARKHPDKLLIAVGGNGSAQHLAAALFQQMTGTVMPLIQYKSMQQGITELIGGQVHLTFEGATSIGAHIRAGRIRGLAVTTAKRSTFFPELPTVAESGVPNYEVMTWGGIVASSGVSKAIVTRLNTELNRALASATVKEKFSGLGAEPMGGTPEAFGALIKREASKWAVVIKAAGIKAE